MAFPEYQLGQYFHIGWIREKDQQPRWLLKTKKYDSDLLTLEEEISSLRQQLENLVTLRKSMSSPEVVAFSTILDEKINEYMNYDKKDR
ncbi:Spo0E like sporulation regulatory protein [Paenibacillus sp. 1_12]|uniref:aspartyl-phosphate phosphatase Spo0E family protein n=1 Tax=Paenibacillus sp. 1_12 TaxID=1566278 RepID=UPI0008F00F40|nr:aspartyl-phosphate phosphatase Spo0E family protein [Paenibacillus sp. 1_12]SFL13410.1 Spo0E like sporulation regulatory protein [Paenibacillus sp. 1_12]